MAQHFLLSGKARTISLRAIYQLADGDAYDTFRKLRWPETDGAPVCPTCGCTESYDLKTRRRFKCKACHKQFSVTSGTIFASRKLSYNDLLAAIVIFMNGAKGVSALQMSRDLDIQYKTAFVLAHKLREAMSHDSNDQLLSGIVETDGAYFGGYVKPANEKQQRKDRRLSDNRSGKRKSVIVMRERGGRTLTLVHSNEAIGSEAIRERVAAGAIIHADEARHWDTLHAFYDTRRINHGERYASDDACTNMAESFFSRLRRAEIGTHHHIAGNYLSAYAVEMTWREDHRRTSNGEQVERVAKAGLRAKQSRAWAGYWQR